MSLTQDAVDVATRAGPASVEPLFAPLGGADAYAVCRREGRTFVVIDEATPANKAAQIMAEVEQMAELPAALVALVHEAGTCGCRPGELPDR